ncbi:MAG: bifunctional demethylmenaquinone methyltransferase/2-methoxy-6-polyprenyl-1,4-benzoquinol methylase UbiE [Hyphomicrobiales bacterium]
MTASRKSQTSTRTHFGFQDVDEAEKQGRVNEVFSKVAARYDLMNDLMSGGLHRAWKDALTTAVAPPKSNRPFRLLDVAGGTGDIAFRFLKAGEPGCAVTLCDINEQMLAEGRKRAIAEGLAGRARFVTGNAEQLAFEDSSFDAYTIAFGIRNVTHIEKALSEAYRVLKPGGHFLCLEFSHVEVPGLDSLYDAYSFTAIPAIGKVVTGDGHPYRYLVESIRKFPDQRDFLQMIADAGFGNTRYRNLSGGIVALHSGWRT